MNVISKAISEDWAVVSGKAGIIPVGFQLDTLKYIITSSEYLRSLLVSVTVTAIGTTLGLLVLGMTAYPLSKPVYATIALFMAVFYWNSYIEPMLYIKLHQPKTGAALCKRYSSGAKRRVIGIGTNGRG